MKRKSFDCVEMVHACQAAVKKRLTGLSREEQLAATGVEANQAEV